MMRHRCTIALAALALLTPALATGQDKPVPQSGGAGSLYTPLKMTVIISRYVADKKVSSLPYVFGVTNNGKATSVRMGSDVPLISRSPKGDAAPTFNYRSVGTNIDCASRTEQAGNFHLTFTIEDTSIHLDPNQKPGMAAIAGEIPSFRSFQTSFVVLMRDGQTVQHTSAADPVTGEVVRIDLTLNVVK
jgi:hypothetical protein